MALPDGVSTCTVTVGTAVDWFGRDASIVGRCTPSAYAVHAATGRPILPFALDSTVSSGGVLEFVVPHVDQAGFVDSNGEAFTFWSYKFNVTFEGLGGTTQIVKWLQPLVGQDTVDLDLVADGVPSTTVSTPIPEVLSVNGATGAVGVSLVEDPPGSGLYELVVS